MSSNTQLYSDEIKNLKTFITKKNIQADMDEGHIFSSFNNLNNDITETTIDKTKFNIINDDNLFKYFIFNTYYTKTNPDPLIPLIYNTPTYTKGMSNISNNNIYYQYLFLLEFLIFLYKKDIKSKNTFTFKTNISINSTTKRWNMDDLYNINIEISYNNNGEPTITTSDTDKQQMIDIIKPCLIKHVKYINNFDSYPIDISNFYILCLFIYSYKCFYIQLYIIYWVDAFNNVKNNDIVIVPKIINNFNYYYIIDSNINNKIISLNNLIDFDILTIGSGSTTTDNKSGSYTLSKNIKLYNNTDYNYNIGLKNDTNNTSLTISSNNIISAQSKNKTDSGDGFLIKNILGFDLNTNHNNKICVNGSSTTVLDTDRGYGSYNKSGAIILKPIGFDKIFIIDEVLKDDIINDVILKTYDINKSSDNIDYNNYYNNIYNKINNIDNSHKNINKTTEKTRRYIDIINTQNDKIVKITYIEYFCIILFVIVFISSSLILLSNDNLDNSFIFLSLMLFIIVLISYYFIKYTNLIYINLYEEFDNQIIDDTFIIKYCLNVIIKDLNNSKNKNIISYTDNKLTKENKLIDNKVSSSKYIYDTNKQKLNSSYIIYKKKELILLFLLKLSLLITFFLFIYLSFPFISRIIAYIFYIIIVILIISFVIRYNQIVHTDYSKYYFGPDISPINSSYKFTI